MLEHDREHEMLRSRRPGQGSVAGNEIKLYRSVNGVEEDVLISRYPSRMQGSACSKAAR